MYGVKLYAVPENLDATIQLWHQLNFNTLFIGQNCKKDSAFLERLQQEGFFVNLVEPVFLADEKTDDSLLAVTKDGSPAKKSWVRFVCPTDKKWLSSLYKRIKKDSRLNVNSLSLDFIRFFQFWEIINPEDDSTVLTETCYCPRCTRQRKKFASPEEWRCHVINSIARKCRHIIKTFGLNKKMGLHTVPWKEAAFKNGVSRILGQNLNQLSKYVDFFTPMVYHHMMNVKVPYIKELLEDFDVRLKRNRTKAVPVIPSVQLKNYYRDESISLEENEQTIKTALEYGKDNLVYFQWADIESNPQITDMLKNMQKK